MKLLLDELVLTATVALLHEVSGHVRRRAFKTYEKAAVQYFQYADAMREAGYEVVSDVHRPWSYDVMLGTHLVERVSLDWS